MEVPPPPGEIYHITLTTFYLASEDEMSERKAFWLSSFNSTDIPHKDDSYEILDWIDVKYVQAIILICFIQMLCNTSFTPKLKLS